MTKQEERQQDLVLWNFMKDNHEWYFSYDENTEKGRYCNPINTAAYGLLFGKSEIWLEAVLKKFVKFTEDHNINMILEAGKVDEGFCFKVFFSKDPDITPELLYHFHSKEYIIGLRTILVQVIEDCLFKYN